MLEDRGQAYVLAVRSNHTLRFWGRNGLVRTDPEGLADALSSDSWTTCAAGEGAKGLRLYDWARISLPWTCGSDWERWLLIRRSRRDPGKRLLSRLRPCRRRASASTIARPVPGTAGIDT
jgi:hypothetical protein